MVAFLKNKSIITLFFVAIIAINGVLLYKKHKGADRGFDSPVPIGTTLNYDWTKSNREALFLFIKPTCGTCALYKDSINGLFDKYNKVLQFNGVYNPKYWDMAYFKSFRFNSIPINSEIRNALHLAFTPQFVLIENNKITFVCNFYVDFKYEFIRLNHYLEAKYGK